MWINIGNKELKEAFLGSKTISEIYLGATKIWPVEQSNVEDLTADGTLYFKVNIKDPSEPFRIALAWGRSSEYDWIIQVDETPAKNVKWTPHDGPIVIPLSEGRHTVKVSSNGPAKRGWAGCMGGTIGGWGWSNDFSKLEFYLENMPVEAFKSQNGNWTHVLARFFQDCKTVIKTPKIIKMKEGDKRAISHFMYGMFWGATNLQEMQEGFTFPQQIEEFWRYCASFMFKKCINLKAIANSFELPMNIKAQYGEYNLTKMFEWCQALTLDPESKPLIIPNPNLWWQYAASMFYRVGNWVPPNPQPWTSIHIKRNPL